MSWRSDRLWAVLAAALSLAYLFARPPELGSGQRDADVLSATLILGTCAVFLARRRAPFAVAVVALALTTVGIGLRYPVLGSVVVSLWLSGYAAIHGDRRDTIWLAVLGGTLFGVAAATTETTDMVLRAIGGIAIGVVPAAIGDAIRNERARTQEAREHLLRIEELRDRDVQRAVAEERLRIARDMHDITGHHLSAIALQAAGAGRSVAEPAARAHLERIHALTTEALGETRRALGVLRDHGPATRAPTPRLEHLEPLLIRARQAGVRAELHCEGDPRPLSEAVEVCAYRVVQESLTNVIRHAHASAVRVSVCYGDRKLQVTVDDDGSNPGLDPGVPGAGIEGMRERVAIIGGTLTAGPAQPRGWSVHAQLPLTSPR